MLDVVVRESGSSTIEWSSGGAGTLRRSLEWSNVRTRAIGSVTNDMVGQALMSVTPKPYDLVARADSLGQSHLRVHTRLNGRWTVGRWDGVGCDGERPLALSEKLDDVRSSHLVVSDFGKRPYPLLPAGYLRNAECVVIASKRYLYEWLPLALLIVGAHDELGGGLTDPTSSELLDRARTLADGRRAPVLVTGGAAGAAFHDGCKGFWVAAPSARHVTIEAGAGDWLAGALAAHLLQGGSINETCLREKLEEATATIEMPVVGGPGRGANDGSVVPGSV